MVSSCLDATSQEPPEIMSSDEKNESGDAMCPLCMEALELDDQNFYPCTCGYQICRFCWHRIRTNENGRCPACRTEYPEQPSKFQALSDAELAKLKTDRKDKEKQKRKKTAESRKHLSNIRVLQKNLVFVVGLSPRLADPEILKRSEYFGKYGKIVKVVINAASPYNSPMGPSLSAYVTYQKGDDAIRAILEVNNIPYDQRTLKASLGTTKYCSHFLKGTQCPKTDCMYLHELGDDSASFTKEDMAHNKHTEYEKHLVETHRQLLLEQQQQSEAAAAAAAAAAANSKKSNSSSPNSLSPQNTETPSSTDANKPSSSQTLATTADPSLQSSNSENQQTDPSPPQLLSNGWPEPHETLLVHQQQNHSHLQTQQHQQQGQFHLQQHNINQNQNHNHQLQMQHSLLDGGLINLPSSLHNDLQHQQQSSHGPSTLLAHAAPSSTLFSSASSPALNQSAGNATDGTVSNSGVSPHNIHQLINRSQQPHFLSIDQQDHLHNSSHFPPLTSAAASSAAGRSSGGAGTGGGGGSGFTSQNGPPFLSDLLHQQQQHGPSSLLQGRGFLTSASAAPSDSLFTSALGSYGNSSNISSSSSSHQTPADSHNITHTTQATNNSEIKSLTDELPTMAHASTDWESAFGLPKSSNPVGVSATATAPGAAASSGTPSSSLLPPPHPPGLAPLTDPVASAHQQLDHINSTSTVGGADLSSLHFLSSFGSAGPSNLPNHLQAPTNTNTNTSSLQLQQQQNLLAANNLSNEENDLGFDPVSESMKGLADLVSLSISSDNSSSHNSATITNGLGPSLVQANNSDLSMSGMLRGGGGSAGVHPLQSCPPLVSSSSSAASFSGGGGGPNGLTTAANLASLSELAAVNRYQHMLQQQQQLTNSRSVSGFMQRQLSAPAPTTGDGASLATPPGFPSHSTVVSSAAGATQSLFSSNRHTNNLYQQQQPLLQNSFLQSSGQLGNNDLSPPSFLSSYPPHASLSGDANFSSLLNQSQQQHNSSAATTLSPTSHMFQQQQRSQQLQELMFASQMMATTNNRQQQQQQSTNGVLESVLNGFVSAAEEGGANRRGLSLNMNGLGLLPTTSISPLSSGCPPPARLAGLISPGDAPSTTAAHSSNFDHPNIPGFMTNRPSSFLNSNSCSTSGSGGGPSDSSSGGWRGGWHSSFNQQQQHFADNNFQQQHLSSSDPLHSTTGGLSLHSHDSLSPTGGGGGPYSSSTANSNHLLHNNNTSSDGDPLSAYQHLLAQQQQRQFDGSYSDETTTQVAHHNNNNNNSHWLTGGGGGGGGGIGANGSSSSSAAAAALSLTGNRSYTALFPMGSSAAASNTSSSLDLDHQQLQQSHFLQSLAFQKQQQQQHRQSIQTEAASFGQSVSLGSSSNWTSGGGSSSSSSTTPPPGFFHQQQNQNHTSSQVVPLATGGTAQFTAAAASSS